MAAGGSRYSTKIRAKRIALSYFKQPHPFRRWKLILSIALPVVAALWLGMHAARDDQRIYNSGPVSTAHTMFEKDCAVCHGPGPTAGTPTSSGMPPAQVTPVTLGPAGPTGYWARATDQACKACHAGPQHHANETFTPECASCHVEHGGRALLVQIADQHCVQCHADLKTKDGATSFHAKLPAFREHPEFAVNVHEGDKILRVRLDQKDQVRDTAQVKLNHSKHLKVNLKGLDDVKSQFGAMHLVKAKDGVQLACTFCHRPDGRGQYMQPIAYEKHCAVCHPLDFDGRFADATNPDKPALVPHDTPTIVHAFLRGTIGDQYDACQSIPAGKPGDALRQRCVDLELAKPAPEPGGGQPGGAPPADEPRGLRRRGALLLRPDDLLLAQDESPRRLRRGGDEESSGGGGGGAQAGGGGGAGGGASAWSATQLGTIEPGVFKQRCEFCHTLNKGSSPQPQVLPTKIPPRWLPHSYFDHAPHRPVACAECHKAAVSTETKDVLMPSVTVCRDCHTPAKTGARSGCVECHRYHNKAEERDPDGPFKVKQLLTGLGLTRSDRLR
jgi:predicted CXXCH cytochrome family protein